MGSRLTIRAVVQDRGQKELGLSPKRHQNAQGPSRGELETGNDQTVCGLVGMIRRFGLFQGQAKNYRED